MIAGRPLEFLKSPGVAWRRDLAGTLVVDDFNLRIYRITGIAEVIWDCLLLSYPASKLVVTIAELTGKTDASTAEEIFSILHEWRDLGLVQMIEK